MVLVRTDFGNTKESARRERFEPVAGNAATNVQEAIQNILSTASGARAQRSINSGVQLPITLTDAIININALSDLTPQIPAASTRNGAPYTIKNLPTSVTQTLQVSGIDLFDGLSSYILNAGSSVTLMPYNDGVNNGYAIE